MPLFFLDLIHCGTLGVDPEGMELSDAAAARAMAIKGARDILRLEIDEGRINLDCCYVIMDADHMEIGRVPFSELLEVNSA